MYKFRSSDWETLFIFYDIFGYKVNDYEHALRDIIIV